MQTPRTERKAMTNADLVALLERLLKADEVNLRDWLEITDLLTALKSGAVVLVNPEELAAKIQAGIVDYINKFGKPIR